MLTPPLCSAGTNHVFIYFSPNKRKLPGLTQSKSCRSVVGSEGATSLYTLGEHIQKHAWFSSVSSSQPDPATAARSRAGAHAKRHASSHALILPVALQPQGAHPHHTCAQPAPPQGVLASSPIQQHPWSVPFICPWTIPAVGHTTLGTPSPWQTW